MARRGAVAHLREATNPKERWVRDEADLASAGEAEEEEEGMEDSESEDDQEDSRRHSDSKSDSEAEEDDEENVLRQSMADVPFEELLRARADGWTTGSQFRKKERPAGSDDAVRGGVNGNAVGERKADIRTAFDKQQRANKNRWERLEQKTHGA